MADRARRRVGLRIKLLVPFLGIPLATLALIATFAWWASGWLTQVTLDRMLGDKLELAVEITNQVARERVEETRRLAARLSRGYPSPKDLDLVAVKERGGPLRTVAPGAPAAERERLAANLDAFAVGEGGQTRFTLLQVADGFLAVAAAPLDRGAGILITGRRLPRELLGRFRSLSGIEMALFAGWQRAALASFAIDLTHCQNCHDAAWRVERISGQFHTARSFKGRRYFTTSLGDGFRYAFMPLDVDGRRVAMVVVRQPIDMLIGARNQTLSFVAGGGFLLLLVSLGTGWGLSHHIAGPITALQRWVESVGEGEPAQRPRIATRDEVQRLAESMSATVSALRDSRDRLDRTNSELYQMVAAQSSLISSMEERLGTFLDLANAPETVPEPDEVAGQILGHVGRLFDCAGTRIVFLDPTDEERVHCLELGAGGASGRAEFDRERDSVLLSAARRSRVPFRPDPSLVPPSVGSAVLVVPISLRARALGFLVLGERRNGADYSQPDLDILAALVRQGAMALEHGFLYARAQEAYLHTTVVLVKTIEAKDPYLRGHSERVSRMAVGAGSRLGLANGALKTLERLARFHDVGKICIDSTILLKPARLTAEEYEAIKRHVEIGEAIVRQITALRNHAFVIGQHHERYDGKGYVKGLGGDEISLEARIIAVCDTFDAMTSARSYRSPLAVREATAEIKRAAGSQLDPTVVGVFSELIGGVDGLVRILEPVYPVTML